MSQSFLQEVETSTAQLDFAVTNECSGFDSYCLGEIRVVFYSCANGLHDVSERYSVAIYLNTVEGR